MATEIELKRKRRRWAASVAVVVILPCVLWWAFSAAMQARVAARDSLNRLVRPARTSRPPHRKLPQHRPGKHRQSDRSRPQPKRHRRRRNSARFAPHRLAATRSLFEAERLGNIEYRTRNDEVRRKAGETAHARKALHHSTFLVRYSGFKRAPFTHSRAGCA